MGETAVCLAVINDGEMAHENSSRIESKLNQESIVDGTEMEPFPNKNSMDSKRDHEWIADGTETESFPNKKQAKETPNDDSSSEVLNPNVSPTENASSTHTISSEPPDLVSTSHIRCMDMTSACTGNSSMESTSDEEHSRKDSSNAASTSQVIMEVPKPTGSSGIRRLIFKFSKSKVAYNNELSDSAGQPKKFGVNNHPSDGSFYEDPANNSLSSGKTGADMCVDSSRKGSPDFGLYSSRDKMALKMSKKVVQDIYPRNVKKLLSTGILEGAPVKYISTGAKKELNGTIKGCGYLCGCSLCNFSEVLNSYEFEQHAGCKTKHPNNHIFLENGRPIYSIVQELKSTPPCFLDEVIQKLAGSALNEQLFQVWKGSFRAENLHQINDKVAAEKQSQLLVVQNSIVSCYGQATEDSFDPALTCLKQKFPIERKSFKRKKNSHVAKKSPTRHFSGSKLNVPDSVMQQKKTAEGGVRKRDNDLHRSLFMPNGLPDGAELAYYSKGQKLLGGYKQGNGIVCSCCNSEVSPSQFEAHAGWATRRQPYRHIYTSNGLSLHDISLSLANGQNLAASDSDDMCTVCGDGGDLVLCDGCPRAFHAACLELQYVAEGDWHCPYCRDKFGPGGKVPSDGSSNALRPITIRLTRIVKAPATEIGGCVVCRAHDFSVCKFDERTVMLCDQCEKEFHVGCLRDRGLCDLKELPKGKWFCSEDCNRIHVALQSLIFNGPEIIPVSLVSTINRKLIEKGFTVGVGEDVQWKILSGKSGSTEHRPLLSKAAAIFRECFDPIVSRSGRDIIPVMVYGRNIAGQDFGGMYCAVLIVKSVVVSAGILRLFGQDVAELPLVATSRENQGKGYFQALFSCIERLLAGLKVENLVLPAAEEAESIWTNKLGFRKMTEEQLLKYTKDLQLTIFQGTSMLEKKVQRVSD